jgi:hypothetical protein
MYPEVVVVSFVLFVLFVLLVLFGVTTTAVQTEHLFDEALQV